MIDHLEEYLYLLFQNFFQIPQILALEKNSRQIRKIIFILNNVKYFSYNCIKPEIFFNGFQSNS